jgi:hypothetical protein
MSVINSQPLIGASGQGGAYNIERSLRFRSSASAYLNRTPASAGSQTTWSWSTWIKRGTLSATQYLFSAGSAISTDVGLFFFSDDTFQFYSRTDGASFATNQLFRDPAAWYHLVFAYDSTQSTSTNRFKVYVNGTQITALSGLTYPSQNATTAINGNGIQYINRRSDGYYFDGYQTETNFIDGQALTPSSFGETDTITGVWKPKKYTGTYGTNGFYLKFNNLTSTSTLGNDSSGNGNTWTVNNVSLTAGTTYDSMDDVPTLTSATQANYCTINSAHVAVVSAGGTYSISNANLSAGAPGAGKWFATLGTFPMAIGSGKWYYEFRPTNSSTDKSYAVGIFNVDSQSLTNPTYDAQAAGYAYSDSGVKANNGSAVAYGATWANGDIIGVAIDASGATTSLTFYKNNTSQGVAYTGITGTVVPSFGGAGANGTFSVNFGQQPFSYTPPSGFVALNTFNLPDSTIVAGNKQMDATTYTGNGSTQTITNAGSFSPDLIWIKSRSNAYNNFLTDSVRGASKYLISNATDAEADAGSAGITAFNSNGFSMGSGTALNANAATYVGWQWRGSDSSAVSNTAGSITSTVSANTSAGFSIVTYTGTGSAATVGHGLGVAPSMMIFKDRTSGAQSWMVYHASLGNQAYLLLNLSNAVTTGSGVWNNTSPTSSVFSLGSPNNNCNASGDTYVAYCWSEIAGFSKFGSYTGNGSTDGVFVYTGFRPKWVMFKRTDSAAGWLMLDSSRNTFNVMNNQLYANASDAESGGATADFLSNGIKIRETGGGTNASGGTYVFMAFAENPLKNSLAR